MIFFSTTEMIAQLTSRKTHIIRRSIGFKPVYSMSGAHRTANGTDRDV